MKRALVMVFGLVAILAVATGVFADWELKQVGGITEPSLLYKVWAIDRNHLYVVGMGFDGLFDVFNEHLIQRSTDGGDTLEPLFTKNINPFSGGLCNSFYAAFDLHFDDLYEGTVVGAWHNNASNCLLIYESNWIAKTTNAGAAWTEFTPTPIYEDHQLNALDIHDSGVGFAVGDAMNVWKTTNGGDTWTISNNVPSVWGNEAPLQDVDVVDEDLVYVTSEMFIDEITDDDTEFEEDFDGDVNGIQGELLRSTNGGTSWQSILSDANLGFHQVQFIDASRGWLLVSNEDAEVTQIRYTTNGATTWNNGVLPTISGIGAPGSGYIIGSFQMLDADNGWAVGGSDYDGDLVILRTTNGGVTWQADPLRGAGQLFSIHMANERVGFAVGSRKSVVGFYEPGDFAPIADAGPDQTVPVGTNVPLDGSGSYDPDGDPLTYQWTQLSGPGVTLVTGTSERPTFDADQVGTITIRLVVADYDTTSAPDSVTIEVVDETDDDADDDVDDDVDDDDSDDDADDDDADDDDDWMPDDDDGGSDDDSPFDCRSLMSMLYDVCDAYLTEYETRFDAENACDEETEPWDCAVTCRANNSECDGLFECLEDECDIDVSRNTTEEDTDGGDISGGCSAF